MPCDSPGCSDHRSKTTLARAIRFGDLSGDDSEQFKVFNGYVELNEEDEIPWEGNPTILQFNVEAQTTEQGFKWASSTKLTNPMRLAKADHTGVGLLFVINNPLDERHGFGVDGNLDLNFPNAIEISPIEVKPGETKKIAVHIQEPFGKDSKGNLKYFCPLHSNHSGGEFKIDSSK